MTNPFVVRLGNKAEKQFKELETDIRTRVNQLFADLEQTPIPFKKYDVKKIKGENDSYRIRLSRFRVLYQISYPEKIIRVTKIERRSENTYD